jgi:hypothetical protein
MYKILGFIVVLFLVGCGYKPTTYYAKDVLGDKIYAQVMISKVDPKNSVIIKDALNEAIITRFLGKLITKEQADTKLFVTLNSTSFSPILYDNNGYVISYKAKVILKFKYEDKQGEIQTLSTSGEYDFPIEANSVISESKRFEAIRYASLDAINEFVSTISVRGMQNGKHSK